MDIEKSKLEEKEKQQKIEEQEQRKEYFLRLKDDQMFQKYIMKGVLDFLLEDIKDITNFNLDDIVGGSPETIKSTIIKRNSAYKQVEIIKNAIENNNGEIA